MFNDATMDISAWASNPVVLKMLQRARLLLQEGAMNDRDLEELLLAHLKHPSNQHKSEFNEHVLSSRRIMANPEELAAAMNEQLDERQLGNRAYTSGDFQTALHHYARGLNVLRLLQPDNPGDQKVIREAELALLLNSAAAHLACGAYGACMEACSTVLSYDASNTMAHLRRAKAHMLRREYQAADEDLNAAEALSNGSRAQELRSLRHELRLLRLRDRRTDKSVYERMFKA
ncbi:hypothetical protein VOLCADRAFT_88302 [Volvox carteri f. nagariensis]|uniref:Uncharacterized protein n=1 Tax=Volvox carteri f. nagariensis TaxID=3068 RepID=D8TNU4_VOLCA|nr:uncharacterized protein VOLCADRAFT_88302 [Volvox carteri f. nagariensis]EFJ50903.1 hypothetical protein VOLCADRAFT_88302 [Volvox carteri f. nagariensis]|eukprot:XP_002947915.1 hypothetical protein VOLCADRAFT_88302 [Volvox carteri f. nagariensis]